MSDLTDRNKEEQESSGAMSDLTDLIDWNDWSVMIDGLIKEAEAQLNALKEGKVEAPRPWENAQNMMKEVIRKIESGDPLPRPLLLYIMHAFEEILGGTDARKALWIHARSLSVICIT